MAELADLLIARHITVSVPDHELRRRMLSGAPEMWELTERNLRCIAVIGAGASAPVLKRGQGLAKSLMQRFHVDQAAVEAERERLRRITNVDPEEFEAQLAALGQALGGDRRVRAAISDLYRVRHPTIQTYELIAHLLKHRFLDGVITMNFDELLDQSLEDELGVGEYQRIVSDRDCISVQTNDLARDHVPLYIKLHGTASEPESLRFTRESYYDSPVRVGEMATELFQAPECVVLNIGFGMSSFDLHRLLAIPERLCLFNLGFEPLPNEAIEAIEREREARLKPSSDQEPCVTPKKDEPHIANEGGHLCDELLDSLLDQIETQSHKLLAAAPGIISTRTVKRHDAVVDLLGPHSGPGRRLIELPRGGDARFSLDPKARAADPEAVYADYLLRRTIFELTLAMVRGHGLVSVGTLAVDRGGHYFDAYRRHAVENARSWQELCTLVGFHQSGEVPDVFEAIDEIRDQSEEARERSERRLLDQMFGNDMQEWKEEAEWHELPQLDLARLTDRVLPHIVDSPEEHRVTFEKALEKLYEGSGYELHSCDDRICTKTFDDPLTLKTLSALDAYSYKAITRLRHRPDERPKIDIITETGGWLLKRGESNENLERHMQESRVRLIIAFLCNVEDLYDRFPRLKIAYQQPWHHNRHMVIRHVRPKDPREPIAVYFARHHRTPYVTPVFVHTRSEVEVLRTAFKDRWKKAKRLPRRLAPPPDR